MIVFAIKIIKQRKFSHDDNLTIKLKVPNFNKKSIDISVDSNTNH